MKGKHHIGAAAARATSYLCEQLEQRMLLAVVSWDGGALTDSWNDAANWSGNVLPTADDDVIISLPASSPTIDLRGGLPATVRTLQSDEKLLIREQLTLIETATLTDLITVKDFGGINGGEWTVTNVSVQTGTQIADGTWHVSGAVSADTALFNRLSNVVVDGAIMLTTTQSRIKIINGTTFTEARLAGSGVALGFGPGSVVTGRIVCASPGGASGAVEMESAGTLTIAPTGVIQAMPEDGNFSFLGVGTLTRFGGNMTLINQGTIRAASAGDNEELQVVPGVMQNEGLIEAGREVELTISGSWSNTLGTIRLTDPSGDLLISGTCPATGMGVIERPAGIGDWWATINNTGNTFILDEQIDPWLLGGTLSGGNLAFGEGQDTNPGEMFYIIDNVNVLGNLSYRTSSADYEIRGSNIRFNELRLVGSQMDLILTQAVLRDRIVAIGQDNDLLVQFQQSSCVIDLRTGSSLVATYIGSADVFIYNQFVADPTGPVSLHISSGRCTLTTPITIPEGSLTLSNRIVVTAPIAVLDGHLSISSNSGFGDAANASTITVNGSASFQGAYEHRVGSQFTVNGDVSIVGQSVSTPVTVRGAFTVSGELLLSGGSAQLIAETPIQIGSLRFATYGTARFNAAPLAPFQLTANGGTLDGSADITLADGSSSTQWMRFWGTGRLIIPENCTFSVSTPSTSTNWQIERPVEVAGTLVATGPSASQLLRFTVATGGALNVLPQGTLDLTYVEFWRDGGSAGPVAVNNAGQLVAHGTVEATALFNHSGTATLDSSTLRLGGGGHLTGTFDASVGGNIEILPTSTTNPTVTFGPGAAVLGTVAFRLNSRTYDLRDVSFSGTGLVLWGSSTITLDDAIPTSRPVQSLSSTVWLMGPVTFGTFTMSGGTVNADSDITILNTLNFDSGTITTAGLLKIAAGALLDVDGTVAVALNGRLENAGMVSLDGPVLTVNTSGGLQAVSILNLAGATISITTGNLASATPLNPTTLENHGTIVRSASAVEVNLAGFYIDNRGMITTAGRMSFPSGGRSAAGSAISVAATGWLDLGGTVGWASEPGSAFTSSGTVRAVGGDVHFAGSTSFADGWLVVNTGEVRFSSPGITDINRLTVQLTGSLKLEPGGDKMLKTSQFSIGDQGRIDLTDNDLLYDYAPGSTFGLAYLSELVARARAGGAWSGPGLTSSAAGANPDSSTTLGVMPSATYRALYGSTATFNGAPLDDSAVVVKYTWYGDTDFNGVVDFDDYVRTDAGFNQARSGWINGDFDGNGIVDFDDYVLIDLGFNTQTGQL